MLKVHILSRRKSGMTHEQYVTHWRDVHADRPEAPLLQQLRIRIAADEDITRAGWASPDVDGGMFHPLAMTQGNNNGERYVELVLPSLKYWDMIVLDDRTVPSHD